MTGHDPLETAWRIHTSIQAWTSNVDNKASFVSAIETAVLLGVVALSGSGRLLSKVDGGVQGFLFFTGIALLVASLLVVLFSVRPRLRQRDIAAENATNFIYFGSLRSRRPEEVEEALREKDPLPILARQLVSMSQIAWQKHRLVQLSVTGATVGVALVALSGVLAN